MSRSVKVNYIYSLIYQIINVLIPLATMPYLARTLGAEGTGVYSFVNANVTYFGMIATFGIATYSQIEVAKLRDDNAELNRFCLESFYTRLLTTLLSVILYVFICFILNNDYKVFYAVSLFTLVSHAFDFTWICQGLENFKTVTIRNAAVKIIGALLIFVFVHNKDDLVWYFLIQSLSSLVGNIIIIPQVKSHIHLQLVSIKLLTKHIKGSFAFFMPTVASVIITTADKIMIGWFDVDKVQNGYYEQAMRIENLIFAIFSALYITMRPRMAYLFAQKDNEGINRYVTKSLSLILFIAFPIVIGIIQISDLFVPWFFGDGFDGVALILKVVSSWIVIKAFSNCLLEQLILPNNGQKIFTSIIWIGAIVNVIINLILIPRFSSIGAATASLIAELLVLIISIKQTKRQIDFRKVLTYVWKPLLSSMIMLAITGLVKIYLSARVIDTLVLIVIGCVTYFGIELLIKDKVMISCVTDMKKMLKRG